MANGNTNRDSAFRAPTALAIVLLLSLLVQAWCITRAAVPAQDALRFVAIAQQIDRHGFIATWREESEHPLFPAIVYATHAGRRLLWPMPHASWGTSAQLASTTLLVLAVAPIYLLLRRLVGAQAGFFGAIFFCVLPEIARLGADALSDSTQLFLIAVALWALSRAWQTTFPLSTSSREEPALRPVWLLLCGGALGLAMMARPEAAVIAGSISLTLALLQTSKRFRQSWRAWATGNVCFALGLLIALPYLQIGTGGQIALMPARLLGRDTPTSTVIALKDIAAPAAPSATAAWRLDDGEPMVFGVKDSSVSSRFHGFGEAFWEFCEELGSVFHYWIGGLALIGFANLQREQQRSFDRFGLLLFSLYSLAAIYLASQLGYLSARHLLTLVVLGLGPAGWGACHLGRWLAEWLPPKRDVTVGLTSRNSRVPACYVAAVALLSAVACLPETLAPLHASRAGHRLAGEWLATAAAPGAVLDTRGWTGLFSHRETVRYDAAKNAYQRPDLAYVVVEQRELRRDSPRAKTLRHLLSEAADQVGMFAGPRGKPDDTVIVYRWHAKRFSAFMHAAKKV